METPLPSLEKLIGKITVARIIAVDAEKPVTVKIVSVEASGIWIESQKVTNHILSEVKVTMSPKTLVFFIPFSGISWIISSADYPAISEKLI